jgi:hypothetical protein
MRQERAFRLFDWSKNATRTEGFIKTPTRRIGEVHQNLHDEK